MDDNEPVYIQLSETHLLRISHRLDEAVPPAYQRYVRFAVGAVFLETFQLFHATYAGNATANDDQLLASVASRLHGSKIMKLRQYSYHGIILLPRALSTSNLLRQLLLQSVSDAQRIMNRYGTH